VFPDGVPDGVTVTADDTISGLLGDPLSYNCIGWTLCSRLFRFVWPPPAIDRGPAGPKLAWFDKLYLSHGWHIAASCTPARGKRKIALYCDSNGPTHAAKQVKDDLWESKCGVAPRITHHGTAALAGGLYGQVCRCYEKSLAALVQEAKAALDDFTKGIQQGIGGDMKDAKAEAEQRVRDLEEALAQEGSN
jgi:hypothetical protein